MGEPKNDNVIPMKSKMQLGFDFQSDNIVTIGEMEKVLKEKKDFYKQYAEKEWLQHYHVMELLSKSQEISRSHVPSFSDMPKAPRGGFYSETEDLALKNIESYEWLKYFHSKLKLLPQTHQEIIELKYLKRNHAGEIERDDFVYQELSLGRTAYYELKGEALFQLGLALSLGK